MLLEDGGGRLLGAEGAARVAVTLERADDETGDTRAEAVVPTNGSKPIYSCSFDALSHLALPTDLGAEADGQANVLRDANESVAALARIEMLQEESRDLDGNTSAGRNTLWSPLDPGLPPPSDDEAAKRLKRRRLYNEKAANHVREVLQKLNGPSLVEKLVRGMLERVEAFLKDLKTARRRKLDLQRQNLQAERKQCPAERREACKCREAEQAALVEARSLQRKMELDVDRLVAQSSSKFNSLEVAMANQRRQIKEFEIKLETLEAYEGSQQGDKAMAVRDDLNKVKIALEETVTKHKALKKNVLEGPQRELLEQRQRVQLMETKYQRNEEQHVKWLKRLQERLAKTDSAISRLTKSATRSSLTRTPSF